MKKGTYGRLMQVYYIAEHALCGHSSNLFLFNIAIIKFLWIFIAPGTEYRPGTQFEF